MVEPRNISAATSMLGEGRSLLPPDTEKAMPKSYDKSCSPDSVLGRSSGEVLSTVDP